MSHLQFITAIPQDIQHGSGCYVGTQTLVKALRQLGVDVALITPKIITPNYTVTRVIFNEMLRQRRFNAYATVGIDADGYSVTARRHSVPHVACVKGVLGDAVRFERGVTRASLAFHARLEAKNARSAALVITVSHYCARRLADLYGVGNAVVVPELIDLDTWQELFRANAVAPDPRKFTVLSVCRFYPRKRLDVLLRAAALLRDCIPELEVRIVGNGQEYKRLQSLCLELRLDSTVRWLGDISRSALAGEYTRAHVFCLPSGQEGFGIVFLEAMAAGKPIVAARAAAVPEVVLHGILVEPENPEALADALFRLHRDPDLRYSLGVAGSADVERFEMHRVAKQFLTEIAAHVPALNTALEVASPTIYC